MALPRRHSLFFQNFSQNLAAQRVDECFSLNLVPPFISVCKEMTKKKRQKTLSGTDKRPFVSGFVCLLSNLVPSFSVYLIWRVNPGEAESPGLPSGDKTWK